MKVTPKSTRLWSSFLRAIEREKAKLNLGADEEVWYRGESSAGYRLLHSLLRKRPDGSELRGQELRDTECDLFFEFRARATELHDARFNDWDVLFAMRHYGVPSRVLDWSDNFAMAVFFALENGGRRKRPRIWLLNPYELNERTWGTRDIIAPEYLLQKEGWTLGDYLQAGRRWDHSRPVAIYPVQKLGRMHAQSGWFTIHGRSSKPLEFLAPTGSVAHVDLPISAIPAARAFLRLVGVSPQTAFPGMVGLGLDLTRKSGFA